MQKSCLVVKIKAPYQSLKLKDQMQTGSSVDCIRLHNPPPAQHYCQLFTDFVIVVSPFSLIHLLQHFIKQKPPVRKVRLSRPCTSP